VNRLDRHVLVPLRPEESAQGVDGEPHGLGQLVRLAWRRLLPADELPSGRVVEFDVTTDSWQGLKAPRARPDILVLAQVNSLRDTPREFHQVLFSGWLPAEQWADRSLGGRHKRGLRIVPRSALQSMGALIRLESTAGAEFATLVVCSWCSCAYVPMFGPGVQGRRACGTAACGLSEVAYQDALHLRGPALIATCEPPPDMRDEADTTNVPPNPEGD
jgi:hypothetical protein